MQRNEQNVAAEEISLRDILLQVGIWFKFLKSKFLLIIVLGIIGGLIGFAVSRYKKTQYIADTTFVLEDSGAGGGGLGQYAGIASMVGLDMGGAGGGIFQGDNLLELYKSRSMIQKTLLTPVEFNNRKQLLVDVYININHLREKWTSLPDLKNISFETTAAGRFSRLQDSIIGTFVKDINSRILNVSKPDKKLSIIKVQVKSEDESFAKLFNEEIVNNVNEFYIQTKTKKSLDNVHILQQKVDSVRGSLNGAIYQAAKVNDETPNINLSRQLQRIVPVQRSQFTAESSKLILSEMLKNLELSKLALMKETPLIQVVDYPILPLTQERLSVLKGFFIGAMLSMVVTILILTFIYIIRNILNDSQMPHGLKYDA